MCDGRKKSKEIVLEKLKNRTLWLEVVFSNDWDFSISFIYLAKIDIMALSKVIATTTTTKNNETKSNNKVNNKKRELWHSQK